MSSLDFLDADFLVNPWPVYAEFRRERPVWWSEKIRMFCVFRHEHVRTILTDSRFTVEFPFRVTDQLFGRTLIDMEGPEHQRLRHRLSTVLNNANLGAFAREVAEPQITNLVRTAAKQMPLEFMETIAERVPTLMICEFLGIPRENERWLFDRMMVLMDHLGGTKPSFSAIASVHKELDEWLTEHISALLREKQVSRSYKRLIDGVSDEPFETIRIIYRTFLAGGIETSMCLLGNAAAVLTLHPEWFARLSDDSSMARAILNEVLRLEPVQATTVRFAMEDLEIDSVTIRKGQAVTLVLASANRDEMVYAAPDVFDPTRTPAGNLSFSTGPHACVGRNFTLANAEIALRTLWQSFGVVQRAEEAGGVIRGASFRRPQSLFLKGPSQSQTRDTISNSMDLAP